MLTDGGQDPLNAQPGWLHIANIGSSVILLVTVAGFLVHHIFEQVKSRTTRINLPDKDIVERTYKDNLHMTLLSHIDTTLNQDGEPVDLDGYWKKVSWDRKDCIC